MAIVVTVTTLPLAGIDLTPPNADEFVVAYDAERLRTGAVPYRDFHGIEPPGAIALDAALTGIIGKSHLAERELGCLWAGLIAALAYAISRRAQSEWLALITAIASGLGAFLIWPYPTAHAPAALCTLAAISTITVDHPSQKRRFAAAVLSTIAGAFHPLFGIAAMLGTLATITKRDGLRALLPMVSGALLVVCSIAIPLAATHALGPAITDLLWPITHYRQAGGFNHVSFAEGFGAGTAAANHAAGFPAVMAFALLAAAVLAAVVFGSPLLVVATLSYYKDSSTRSLPLAVTALSLSLLALYQRPDLAHLALAAILTFPALALMDRPLRALARTITVCAAAGATLLLCARLASAPSLHPRFDSEVAQWPEIQLLRAHTREGDSIAVLPAGGLYYFYARPDALGYSWLLPPSAHYHDQSDYAAAATSLIHHHAKLVWFTSQEAERDFLENGGALSQALKANYHKVEPAPDISWWELP